jgi:hypothetical protein
MRSLEMREQALTALILILANQLREQARERGEEITRDFIPDAVQLIRDKQQTIFDLVSRRGRVFLTTSGRDNRDRGSSMPPASSSTPRGASG